MTTISQHATKDIQAMRAPEQRNLIFLCGLHRSGTSPLFRMLREHPFISGFQNTGVPEDEGQHLQTVFPPAKVFGGPGLFGFAPAAHLTEDSELITIDNRRKLFEEWTTHWDLSRPYLLEKSPPNLIRSRFLQAMFPHACFVVLVRHPIAVALATVKWANTGIESLVEHWFHCHRIFEQDRPHLKRVLLIRYEDLIAETQITLRRVLEFIGLTPMQPTVLDPSGNERYFSSWRNLQKDPQQSAQFARIVSKYEEEASRYGYSFADCSRLSQWSSSGQG